MDPEMERRLATMIMDEASFLRREAERDGVAAYLAKPKIRGRANPQFLQATVRSIQQSNKIVEVNEMWRRRKVEVEYEKARSKSRSRDSRRRRDSPRSHGEDYGDCSPSSDRYHHRQEFPPEDTGCDGGLKDEELEQFLHSRHKRGRGAVGSRMDETGPYLRPQNDSAAGRAPMPDERLKNDWEDRIYGPQAGPSASASHLRNDDAGSWKRMQRDTSIEEGEVEEEAGEDRRARRTDRKKEKKRKQEKDSKKRKRQKLEKSSKRRR